MPSQKFALGFGLHAFGHDGQTQALRQADDGAGNGSIVGVGEHILDESPVDFQLIQWQVLQIGQR